LALVFLLLLGENQGPEYPLVFVFPAAEQGKTSRAIPKGLALLVFPLVKPKAAAKQQENGKTKGYAAAAQQENENGRNKDVLCLFT
jgi:hypothetical protein